MRASRALLAAFGATAAKGVKADRDATKEEEPFVPGDLSENPNDAGKQSLHVEKLRRSVDKAREAIQRRMCESGIPGLSVAVAVDGKTVWKQGFGFSDLENQVRATGFTVCRIASISKTFTALAVAKLWERGKVDLDKPVGDYLDPDTWPADKSGMTVRQLLNHSSGVRSYVESGGGGDPDEFRSVKAYATTKESLEMFKDDELIRPPGETFHYSTHGYTVLAAVVEAVSGEPFDDHLSKLFKELGLNNTYLDRNDPLIPNRSRYYRRNEKHRVVNAPAVDNSYKWAGGGLLSNVGDLVRFGTAMLYSYQSGSEAPAEEVVYHPGPFSRVNRSREPEERRKPGYLKKETVEEMWTGSIVYKNGEKDDPEYRDEWHYGLGWGVLPAAKRHEYCRNQKFSVAHTGGSVGSSSVLLIAPRDDDDAKPPPRGVVVAIVCNMENVGLQSTALEIARHFANIKVEGPNRVQKVFEC